MSAIVDSRGKREGMGVAEKKTGTTGGLVNKEKEDPLARRVSRAPLRARE